MSKTSWENRTDLKGKAALVTGGAGELCGEMCRALAECGCRVAVLDYDLKKAEAMVKKIRSRGGKAIALQADVTDKSSLEKAGRELVRQFRGLDILINGAGGNSPLATTNEQQGFFELSDQGIRKVFELNILGTIFASQVFGKIIHQTRGAGNIINISSMNSFRPLTRIPAYSSAKAGVSNFTKWLAAHFAQNYTPKIRVNAIAPGFFITTQNRFLLMDKKGKLTPRGERILDHTPAGRFGKPGDLLSALFWLISPESQFITGIVVPVDGGFSAYSGV